MYNVLCLTTQELMLGMSPSNKEEAQRWLEYYKDEYPNMEFDLLDHAPGYPQLVSSNGRDRESWLNW